MIRKCTKESVLLIHPIRYDRSGQNKSVRGEGLISRKSEHLSIHLSNTDDLTVHFGQCISTEDDSFFRNIYVYARSIRYVIDFSAAIRERTSQASIELLEFFKHRPPTAICLIERAADNLIHFQAVVKTRDSQASTRYSSTAGKVQTVTPACTLLVFFSISEEDDSHKTRRGTSGRAVVNDIPLRYKHPSQ